MGELEAESEVSELEMDLEAGGRASG